MELQILTLKKYQTVSKKLCWNDVEFQRLHSEELNAALDMISPINLETVTSECAVVRVNSFSNKLSTQAYM